MNKEGLLKKRLIKLGYKIDLDITGKLIVSKGNVRVSWDSIKTFSPQAAFFKLKELEHNYYKNTTADLFDMLLRFICMDDLFKSSLERFKEGETYSFYFNKSEMGYKQLTIPHKESNTDELSKVYESFSRIVPYSAIEGDDDDNFSDVMEIYFGKSTLYVTVAFPNEIYKANIHSLLYTLCDLVIDCNLQDTITEVVYCNCACDNVSDIQLDIMAISKAIKFRSFEDTLYEGLSAIINKLKSNQHILETYGLENNDLILKGSVTKTITGISDNNIYKDLESIDSKNVIGIGAFYSKAAIYIHGWFSYFRAPTQHELGKLDKLITDFKKNNPNVIDVSLLLIKEGGVYVYDLSQFKSEIRM